MAHGARKCYWHSGNHGELTAGLAAESEVSHTLTSLIPDGCLVLNNVPFPYGNLDHVVIKPDSTTILIETKSHRGIVTWSGKQLLINKRPFASNPITQVNRSIRWIRKIAKQLFDKNPWVVAVLVFPNARVAMRGPVKRINVMPLSDLLPFIRNYHQA